MTLEKIQSMLTTGENIAVEFKGCGNGIEQDEAAPFRRLRKFLYDIFIQKVVKWCSI